MDTGGIAVDQLRSLVERYERLQEEIDALNEDRSELMKQVESSGFDKKIFKIVIRRRRMGNGASAQEDMFVQLYERALANLAEDDPSRTRTREDASGALRRVVRDFVRDVPEDTTVSIATNDGKGFAVTKKDGHRTVRQFGEEEAPAP